MKTNTSKQERVNLKRVLLVIDALLSYRVALLITLLLVLIIGSLALTPTSRLFLHPPENDFINHFLAFCSLSFFISTVRPRDAFWLAPMCLLYGATIEILQPFVNRYGEWSDFFADCIGTVAGVALGAGFFSMRKKL